MRPWLAAVGDRGCLARQSRNQEQNSNRDIHVLACRRKPASMAAAAYCTITRSEMDPVFTGMTDG